jgi:hypothetical protein
VFLSAALPPTIMILAPPKVSALDSFRGLTLADEALQTQLGSLKEPERFIELAVRAAASHGVALSREELKAALRPDPPGIERWRDPPATFARWPGKHWLPTHVAASPEGRLSVDWTYFGESRLSEPFFEMSALRAAQRPFNLLCRYRTNLDHFLENAALDDSLAPAGFIFHESRCGSTLVAQMLAAVAQNVVVSEAGPLDAIVQLKGRWPGLSISQQVGYLTAMAAALGRRRFGDERRFFLKLDCWHAMALPLFRQAFPSTPWVFLYREPVEILVSQMRQRGLQTVPGAMPSRLYAIEGGETMPGEDYCARVLEQTCAAVVDHFDLGGGLLVNYDDLPDAVFTKISPHFGNAFGECERAAMLGAARRNAKAPHQEFASDKADKQRLATESIRVVARRRLAQSYAKLEAMRLTPEREAGLFDPTDRCGS